ncbi:hypothetical protein E1286_40690 [Nonomuraea terrae]|uniref:Tyr recombinase domain-containing protein n=1 Tax=Nonomuraea terrae TaxID=2530383 RepID=A0A4R4XSY0_9ACTN|nr:hypothetical protein E1286_40690 [Nonomuraea terrae]
MLGRTGGRCRPSGCPPGFKALAQAAGLPVIRLHEARHTAATLGLEAGLDIKIVSAQLGHSRAHHARRVHARAPGVARRGGGASSDAGGEGRCGAGGYGCLIMCGLLPPRYHRSA